MRSRLPLSRLAVLMVLSLLWSGSAALADDPAFRAFWADAFHAGFKSTSEIDTMISYALTGNYNAVIAEVLAYHDAGTSAHGAYWNSSIVPKATDISGGIDPLAYLVSRAHAVGLEVHAWIVPYRVCTSWPPSGNSLLAANPAWLMVPLANMGGGPATIGGKYVLDPGSPEVQEYLVSIVQELVTDYAIDGVSFDYIRYTQVNAGYPADTSYTKSTLARFQELTGYVGTPPHSGETSWNNFRRRTINELVRRCRAEIPWITSNPRQPLRFTADLITFGDAPGSFTSSDAYASHQNWRYWMEQGWLDAGIPMNYKREYSSQEASWYRGWV
ncbi:MAG: family 10 glycosylhydrolase, partial [Planctomycetes bacterium]|nr:family 10 glycosylhydrolase [Planctomycetota bacterium]